jgi:hypothetical protein
MAFQMAHEAGPFYSFVDLISCTTIAKRPCYGLYKIKPSYNIVHYNVFSLFIYYGGPLMAMEAILAIIADGRRAIILIYREAVRNKLISYSLYKFILNPSMAATSNPLRRCSRGWGMFLHPNHAAGGGNGSIMVGMFLCLCLSSQNLSQ